MTRSTLAAFAAILALGSAGSALAEPPAPSIEIAVSQADLADPGALQARIEEAATEVCRDRVIGDLLRPFTLRGCIEATTAHAMAQLDTLLEIPAEAHNQLAAREPLAQPEH